MRSKYIGILSALVVGAIAGVVGHAQWARLRAPATPPPVVTARMPVIVARGDAALQPTSNTSEAGTNFTYEYVPPRTASLQPIYQAASEGNFLQKLHEIKAIDGLFMLPTPIKFVTAECKSPDAFYAPATHEVVLCYETIDVLNKQAEAMKAAGSLQEEFPHQYVLANLRFILLHETGHALIRLLDLPTTGREEDAVDQLAVMLMQKFASLDESPQQVSENLRMAANWFLHRAQGQYNLDAYADEHALGEQRYFNLQCLIYGRDPGKYLYIVTDGDLPAGRAERCPEEARRVDHAWLRLLLPHVAPKFQMTEEKALRFFDQQERARRKNVESPYVR
ncbi:DUF4344 domain-containing metallopeptidase [Aerolutibacter daejeonensis]|uniref:DUF4344 domain-containing metallopeptidase n=1 Tax=Aerolutibacter daejeonensis TaxID=346181 RepID=UPI00068B9FA9|nr:DUF4344 domain-containing metallopeptidase [Lysobacter daejeonensis]